MGKPSEYDRLHRKALKKGWVIPANDGTRFDPETWIRYWRQEEAHGQGRLEGRPIPPHRSGGGRVFL